MVIMHTVLNIMPSLLCVISIFCNYQPHSTVVLHGECGHTDMHEEDSPNCSTVVLAI